MWNDNLVSNVMSYYAVRPSVCPSVRQAVISMSISFDLYDNATISTIILETLSVGFHFERRMVRSAHLALFLIRFTAQFDFSVSDRYSYQKIHTASLGMTKWADLSTSHNIKPSPKGSGLMW